MGQFCRVKKIKWLNQSDKSGVLKRTLKNEKFQIAYMYMQKLKKVKSQVFMPCKVINSFQQLMIGTVALRRYYFPEVKNDVIKLRLVIMA